MLRLMGNLLKLIWCFVIGLFRSRAALEAEIVAPRYQPNVLRRKAPKAGDSHPLASGRVSLVLAMEIALSRRQTEGPA